jgi:hypothetical protein
MERENIAMKKQPTKETVTPNEDKSTLTPRRSDKDTLRRDILRVTTHVRAGGSADDEGNDL